MKFNMTLAEAIAFAKEWSQNATFHEGSMGWRVVCLILAEEVERLSTISQPSHAALTDEDVRRIAIKYATRISLIDPDSYVEFIQAAICEAVAGGKGK